MANRYGSLVKRFQSHLQSQTVSPASTAAFANELWSIAVDDVGSGQLDDRPLYWSRLSMQQSLQQHRLSDRMRAFEWHSRNSWELQIPSRGTEVLLTGFDPFDLDTRISQSNPSGVLALALHGQQVADARIASMIFPVRYRDFDNGCIERCLTPALKSPTLQLVVTVSMGRNRFDLERFPARCRGAMQPDNEGVVVASAQEQLQPSIDGPEYLEFTLPARQLGLETNAEIAVADNCVVETVERGRIEASSLTELAGCQAISGSGGNFLSNEIAYRSLLLRRVLGSQVPMGHIHVPRIEGYDAVAIAKSFRQFVELLTQLIKVCRSNQAH